MNTQKKTILFIFALLFSVSSWSQVQDGIGGDSGGPKQTWEEIFENPRLKPHFPAIVIQGHLIDYNFLCMDKTHNVVRTKYEIRVETDKTGNNFLFDYLFEEPIGDHYVCSDYRQRCYYESIPVSQKIYVYRVSNDYAPGSRSVLFTKDYELPTCK